MISVEADESSAVLPSISRSDREGFAAFLLRARAHGIDHPALLSAVEAVPRRGFVPAQFQSAVWGARTVPIACGETLESLDLQARLLSALKLADSHRVLEVGTGSGYTAALMGKIVKRVYTIERFRTLHHTAHQRLRSLSLDNVIAQHGDGALGSTDGPFDRIMVWGAFPSVPRAFVDQLVSGGEMICAIGAEDEPQALYRLTKVGSRFDAEEMGTVRWQMLRAGIARTL